MYASYQNYKKVVEDKCYFWYDSAYVKGLRKQYAHVADMVVMQIHVGSKYARI